MLTTIKPPVWFIILIIGFPQLSETIFAPLLPFIVDKLGLIKCMDVTAKCWPIKKALMGRGKSHETAEYNCLILERHRYGV